MTTTRVARACLERSITDLLNGGHNAVQDHDVAEMWTEARVQRIYGGTNEITRELIARGFTGKT